MAQETPSLGLDATTESPTAAPPRPTSPLVWVLLVAGIALAGFGIFRFVAPDSEIEGLHDDIEAVQDERADVEASVAAVQDRVEAATVESADLDASVTAMVDAFEAYATSYEATIQAFNTAYIALFEQGIPQSQSLVNGQLAQAVADSEAALVDLQDSISTVLTTLSELEDDAAESE